MVIIDGTELLVVEVLELYFVLLLTLLVGLGTLHVAGADARGGVVVAVEGLFDLLHEHLLLGLPPDLPVFVGEVPEVGLGPAVDHSVRHEHPRTGLVGLGALLPEVEEEPLGGSG